MNNSEQFRKDFQTLQQQNLQLVALVQKIEQEKAESLQMIESTQEHNQHLKEDIEKYRHQHNLWQEAHNKNQTALDELKIQNETLQAQIETSHSSDELDDDDLLQEQFEDLTFRFNEINQENLRLRQDLQNPLPKQDSLDMGGQQDLQVAQERIEDLEEDQQNLQTLVEKLTAENLELEKNLAQTTASQGQTQALTEWQEAYSQLQKELQNSLEAESSLKDKLESSRAENKELRKEDSQLNALRDENSQLIQDKIFLEQENESTREQLKISQKDNEQFRREIEVLHKQSSKEQTENKNEPKLLLKKSPKSDENQNRPLPNQTEIELQKTQQRLETALSQIASIQDYREEIAHQNKLLNQQIKDFEKKSKNYENRLLKTGSLYTAIALISLIIGFFIPHDLIKTNKDQTQESPEEHQPESNAKNLSQTHEWPSFQNDSLTIKPHDQHLDIFFKKPLFAQKKQLNSGQGLSLIQSSKAIAETFNGYQIEVISKAIHNEDKNNQWSFMRATQIQIALMRAGIPKENITSRFETNPDTTAKQKHSVQLRISPKK